MSIGLIWVRTGTNDRLLCGHGNKPSGPIKCGEFLVRRRTSNFTRATLFHIVR